MPAPSSAPEQRFDFDGLKGRLHAPAAGQPCHAEMIAELRRLFDAHQVSGQVCFAYDTRMRLGR